LHWCGEKPGPQTVADYVRQQNGAEPADADIFAGCDRPRQYAAAIDALPTGDIAAALERVPAEWQSLVKTHVRRTREVRRAHRDYLKRQGAAV